MRADVLAIDADGRIDEIFSRFYDMVEPGGIIILDDCADLIISRVRESIERMRGASAADLAKHIERIGPGKVRLLLGKHKLTYHLASYFEEIGAISHVKLLGKNTEVYRKSFTGRYSELDLSGVPKIDADILDQWMSACAR